MRDLFALDSRDFQIEDIAARLAKVNRFAGATKWPYSVATHCVLVAGLCPDELSLAGLCHDLTEAFGIGDLISPVKRLCPHYHQIEARIAAQLEVPFPALARAAEVKPWDERAYQLECYFLRGVKPEPWRDHDTVWAEPTFLEQRWAAVCLDRELTWQESMWLFLRMWQGLVRLTHP